jgi:hypothetical protein
VDNIHDLRVMIDNHLKFDQHFSIMILKGLSHANLILFSLEIDQY